VFFLLFDGFVLKVLFVSVIMVNHQFTRENVQLALKDEKNCFSRRG